MKLKGLVAATYTPMRVDGSVNPNLFEPMFDFMINTGASAFYVCGSTGEGPSLTAEERKLVANLSVRAASRRAPVIVQVGSNSLSEARALAAHAAEIGADAISAVPPFYFKPATPQALVASIATIASAAPDLPFYYYHIPRLTGITADMPAFLALATDHIPNLAGIKFSDPDLSQFRLCQEFENARFDILFGCDEMMLGALAMGAKAAVGSSYGFAAPLWNRIIAAFDKGDSSTALAHQSTATRLVRFLDSEPGPYHATVKQVLWPELGFELGTLRQPHAILSPQQISSARQALQSSGFLDLIR